MILLPFLSISQADDGWNLALSKNGIEVYTRKPDNLKMKEFRAEANIKAKPEKILEMILDAENYKNWMANVQDGRILKKEDENTYYIYSSVDMPWPFDDRYEISKTEVVSDSLPGTIFCNVTIEKGDAGEAITKENEGMVRIVNGFGYWKLTDDGKGVTHVVYSFYADPGGNLPAGVVNMFVEKSPYKTLSNLKKIVE